MGAPNHRGVITPAPCLPISLLRRGVPLTLLMDLVQLPDSRALLEGERVSVHHEQGPRCPHPV